MMGTVMVRSMVLVAVMVAGCAVQGQHGKFDRGGYVSRYGYMIPYEHETSLMVQGWMLDNFVRRDGRMLRKSGDEDLVTYKIEANGSVDDIEGYKYELHWENRKHAGIVALSDIPLPPKYGERELHVLMRAHIAELSDPVPSAIENSDGLPPTILVQKPGMPVVVQEGPAVLAGQPAYVATVDLVPPEQPAGTGYSPSQRVQLVLMRPPHDERFEPTNMSASKRYPMVLLASYTNAPSDFAAGLADFHKLLRSIVIAGKAGFEPPAPAAPAAEPMAALTTGR